MKIHKKIGRTKTSTQCILKLLITKVNKQSYLDFFKATNDQNIDKRGWIQNDIDHRDLGIEHMSKVMKIHQKIGRTKTSTQ